MLGLPIFRRVARNSKWGAALGVWGRSPQPPEAGGFGAKPPGPVCRDLTSSTIYCRKSFYLLIVALEVARTLVAFRDRANIYTKSSETT